MITQLRGLKPQEIAAAAFRLRELGIVIALGVAVVFFAIRAPNFLTVSNWQDIAKDVAIVVVVAVGETMVVLTRNIDLSVGSMVGLSAYLSADFLAGHNGAPLVLVALIAMGIGTVFTTFQGVAEPLIRELLHIPDDVYLCVMIAAGYPERPFTTREKGTAG